MVYATQQNMVNATRNDETQLARPTIAACLAMRNVEQVLANCLARLQPFVDEIVVADLGSSDRSVAIAREYGARIARLRSEEPVPSIRSSCQQLVHADWILWVEVSDLIPERLAEQFKDLIKNRRPETNLVDLVIDDGDRSAGSCSGPRLLQIARRSGSVPHVGESSVGESSIVPAPADQAIVDVIVLSYAKTDKEYALTCNCLKSLRASEAAIQFNVVVVETNDPAELRAFSSDERWFDDECRVVFPKKQFNYNEFLQIGFNALQDSTAEAVLIANNDVEFGPGFASALLSGLNSFASVSPWCPGYHEQFFDGSRPFQVGRRTSYELCGWALMFRKDLLKRLPFEQLFPTEFAFWFQDNYYGWQLERLGIEHALVTASKVRHHFQQSHELIESDRKVQLTTGAQEVFSAKTSAVHTKDEILLTVAIPSLPSRVADLLPQLVEKLSRQAEGKPVEILSLMDNKRSTLGAKRNALVGLAQGRFIAFVDDDDDVADDYVDRLLEAIRADANVDCIAFQAWVTMNGSPGRVCKYSIQYDDVNRPDAYYRRPNQVCCFRTEVARRVPRNDVTWGEDSAWAKQILPHVQREARLDQILYFYRYDAQRSEAPQPFSVGASESDQKALLESQSSNHANPQLTVGVLSISSRVRRFLPTLIHKLAAQAEGRPVELVALLDNRRASIGAKRNALSAIAHGQYIAFVDDDDDVADDYVETLLAAIEANPGVDCIVFDARVTHDGGHGKSCRYGLEYANEDRPDGYYRRPNHLCCIRANLVKTVPFEDVSWHEDFFWADAIGPHLRTQARIEKVLYHYRYDSATSESAAPQIRASGDRARTPLAPQRSDPPAGQIPTYGTSCRSSVPDGSDADQLSPPIYGFMHVAMLNHWHSVVEEQLLKLRASGLWNRTRRIFVGLLGPRPEEFDFADDKLEVVYRSADIGQAEFPTLEFLQHFCKEKDCLVYYIHTKGVFHLSETTRDWRHLMEHFVIQRHEECTQSLVDHDLCGVNWNVASLGPHFSGNFWWARSAYVRTLPSLASLRREMPSGRTDRHLCERWIGMNTAARVAVLHQSEINHYYATYPRSKYAQLSEVKPSAAFGSPSAWRGLEQRFQDLLEGIGPIRTVIELGVEFGYSLFSLAAALPHATVIGIDPYKSLPETTRDRLRQLGMAGVAGTNEAEHWVRRFLPEFRNALLLRATSEEVARRFIGRIDVLHLDAVPTYEDVQADFDLWESKLRPGGCVLFHDTVSFPNSVGRFFRELPGRKVHIRDCHGLGAWYKPTTGSGSV